MSTQARDDIMRIVGDATAHNVGETITDIVESTQRFQDGFIEKQIAIRFTSHTRLSEAKTALDAAGYDTTETSVIEGESTTLLLIDLAGNAEQLVEQILSSTSMEEDVERIVRTALGIANGDEDGDYDPEVSILPSVFDTDIARLVVTVDGWDDAQLAIAALREHQYAAAMLGHRQIEVVPTLARYNSLLQRTVGV